MAAVMVVMRLATQRATHWWWALGVLQVVGVASRLILAVMKVPAMEMNTAAAAFMVMDVLVQEGTASMAGVLLMMLLKLRETTLLKVGIK